jgi:DNA-binding HxlR family transcriptional regulator
MNDAQVIRLAQVFRTLAEPIRLRILGAIAEGPLSNTELSARLRLSPPTISHHMARLIDAGLVEVTAKSQKRLYSLDLAALQALTQPTENMTNQALSHAASQDNLILSNDTTLDRERMKILRDFFEGPRLKQIPAQRRKRVIVLQHLLTRFTPGHDYPEPRVNDLLREAHDDVATLRRELVDYGFMTRDRGVYRISTIPPPRGPTVAQEIPGDEHAWLKQLVSQATAKAIENAAPLNGSTDS